MKVNFHKIPDPMKGRLQWVLWRHEPGKDGKPTKVPYQPSGQRASSTNPQTWSSFTDIVAAYRRGGYSGIGYVLNGEFVAWDLDKCRDPKTGHIKSWAESIVKAVASYTEVTPSGTGLRIICRAELPVDGKKRGGVEVYQRRRYITVTGWHLEGTPATIEGRNEECLAVFKEQFPEQAPLPKQPPNEVAANGLPDWEIIARAHKSKNGDKFARLWAGDITGYPSHSEADQALCNMLAFWTDGDAGRIDSLFRQSGLYREKWERADYRTATINKAIAGTADNYEPSRNGSTGPANAASGRSKSLKPADYTDVGQAKVLATEYGHVLRYSLPTNYLYYTGQVWRENVVKAHGCAQQLSERQLKEATTELRSARAAHDKAIEAGDEEAEKEAANAIRAAEAYRKFVLSRRQSSRITATLKEAQPMLEIDVEELDADPFKLNTPAGTVDLRTGKRSPHSPWDYCTKITAVGPGDKGADLFADFLRVITCGDQELESYLQLIAGMAAVGKVFAEHLIIAYGSGRNGKSTFFNLLSQVLGDYAGGLSAEILTVDSRKNKSPEYAELRGKRLVIAGELEEGRRLDTAAVKRICSTDPIRAEKKYRDPFTFTPSHTTVLYTNHLPRVGTTDEGTWRRLIVVPFNAVIPKSDDIKNYADYLFNHAGGAVLSWIIEGAQRFIEARYQLDPPESVRQAIQQYRKDSDWLDEYLSERCEIGVKYQERAGELYTDYRAFCSATGVYTRSAADFRKAIEGAGFTARRTSRGWIYYGLRLRSEFKALSAETFAG